MIEVQINPFEMRRVIGDLQRSGKAIGLTLQHVIWEVAADSAQMAMKYTAPRKEKVGTWPQQRAQGEKAVTFDLMGRRGDPSGSRSGLFGFLTDEMKVYQTFNGGKELPNYNLIKLKSGAVYLVDKNFSLAGASIDTLRQIHVKARGKNGRVSTAGRHDRNVGRWKAKHKYFAEQNTVIAYLNREQGSVGKLKARWAAGLRHFAAKTMKKTNIPFWVQRHEAGGGVVDAVNPNGNGFVSIENLAPHRQGIRLDMMLYIQSVRQRDVETFLPKRLERIAARFNSVAATGQREVG